MKGWDRELLPSLLAVHPPRWWHQTAWLHPPRKIYMLLWMGRCVYLAASVHRIINLPAAHILEVTYVGCKHECKCPVVNLTKRQNAEVPVQKAEHPATTTHMLPPPRGEQTGLSYHWVWGVCFLLVPLVVLTWVRPWVLIIYFTMHPRAWAW
jgi:hypothetical protein